MKLIKGKPPIYDKIIEAGLQPSDRAVFAWGDSLYIQDQEEKSIDPVLLYHEEVHKEQQEGDVEGWWNKYLNNPQFRYEQELEAYGEQYGYILTLGFRDRIKKHYLNLLATDLASPMYGSLVSVLEAESRIRNKAKI